ncbi:hypothetical protein [Kordiimonas pumila]|uniref:Uncharacterized protein n=1 Tax=Kordiimonas pumila TaxID=2161677 RepID=A0ABV7D4Q6_9PROT|nr:hypothetical protein [Kordiimonas pumila]
MTFPANDMARTSAVKSATLNPADSERGFERMLRDNGFSRTRAKAITAKGFKAYELSASESTEIAAMVRTLKARQMRLDTYASHLCKDGCTDCEPCRKGWNDKPDCNYLKNDIASGNKSRWDAWQKLGYAVKKLEQATKKFAQEYDEDAIMSVFANTAGTVMKLFEAKLALTRRNPVEAGKALYDAGNMLTEALDTVFNYEGKRKREFQAQVGRYKNQVDRLHGEAIYLEKIFWDQVNQFKKDGCEGLHAIHFNRP